MTRETAVNAAAAFFDEGRFETDLARRVAIASTSQEPEQRPELARYLTGEVGPALAALGFTWSTFDNPEMDEVPFLVAERIEDPALPTVLTYGHGDTVRGHEGRWRDGRDPWTLSRDGDRLYGRGTADNKAQHTINQLALEAALKARDGKLGYNVKVLIETGEEVGSPGLRPFCRAEAERLKADLLVASDGPRVSPD
ncbi:MAG: M20/M25/M40 family metallo-hydrolase, partial [Tistlia sp.]